MQKKRVAILGPGNAGCDLMYKVFRSKRLELGMMAGIIESEGIKRARGLGVCTSIDGIYGLLEAGKDITIAFDATGARQHEKHAALLRKAGITAIDLTPSAVGRFIIPWVNLHEAGGAPNISMATCAAQAAAPVIAAVAKVARVHHAEVVACVSSSATGPASRENIQRYTATTARALAKVGGARSAKAVVVFNPIQPPLIMTNTIYMRLAEFEGARPLEAAQVAVERMGIALPGYSLRGEPAIATDRLSICVQIETPQDCLPVYSGNLHILNAAAIKTAEEIL